MIYTHVLGKGAMGVKPRWTGCGARHWQNDERRGEASLPFRESRYFENRVLPLYCRPPLRFSH
jgi:hypothetical protein